MRQTLGHEDIKTTEAHLSLTDQDIQEARKSFHPASNSDIAPNRLRRRCGAGSTLVMYGVYGLD